MTTPPAIVVAVSPNADLAQVTAVLLGCEEEGVPVIVSQGLGKAEDLARMAADSSGVFIGIGVDDTGCSALRDQRMRLGSALVIFDTVTARESRFVGVAAGRLVKGRPIPSIVACNNNVKSPSRDSGTANDSGIL